LVGLATVFLSQPALPENHVNPDNLVNPVKLPFPKVILTGFTGLDMIYMMIPKKGASRLSSPLKSDTI
jgi:hypothetical protein